MNDFSGSTVDYERRIAGLGNGFDPDNEVVIRRPTGGKETLRLLDLFCRHLPQIGELHDNIQRHPKIRREEDSADITLRWPVGMLVVSPPEDGREKQDAFWLANVTQVSIFGALAIERIDGPSQPDRATVYIPLARKLGELVKSD